MTDRLTLIEALEDAGIERSKATHIATVIFDAIQQNGATRADVQASEARPRSTAARTIERQITFRLICIVAVAVAVIIATQHIWPPH
jgi:hypothetical protein